MMPRHFTRVVAVPLVVAVGVAACGDDEPDNQAFCEAHRDVERTALATSLVGDGTDLQPKIEALADEAPDEISPTVTEIAALVADGAEESPEFNQVYGELITFVGEACDYPSLSVAAAEYAFTGLPATVDAGPTVVTLQNDGAELHHIVVMRINEGVTESIEELLDLPDEEAFAKVSPVGETFAFPGTTGTGFVELVPGRHVAICFLPQGATPDNMATIESGDHQGAPHFTAGMVQEFEVS